MAAGMESRRCSAFGQVSAEPDGKLHTVCGAGGVVGRLMPHDSLLRLEEARQRRDREYSRNHADDAEPHCVFGPTRVSARRQALRRPRPCSVLWAATPPFRRADTWWLLRVRVVYDGDQRALTPGKQCSIDVDDDQ